MIFNTGCRDLKLLALWHLISSTATAPSIYAPSFYPSRSTRVDEIPSGVQSWTFMVPPQPQLNSGFFASRTSEVQKKAKDHQRAETKATLPADPSTQSDLLATRIYADRGGNAEGITPASLSLAYYSNASTYAFDYSQGGFVTGNTAGGRFDTLYTVSITHAFEFTDANGDGVYDRDEKILSSFELKNLVWNTPCSSVNVTSATEDSSEYSVQYFSSLLYNPSFSNLTLELYTQYGTGQPDGLGVLGGGAQGLVLTSMNSLIDFRISGYDYVSPSSLLALNITVLSSRVGMNTTMEPRLVDLSGMSGRGGFIAIPSPSFDPALNRTVHHEFERNCIRASALVPQDGVTDVDAVQNYVTWENTISVPEIIVFDPTTNQTILVQNGSSSVQVAFSGWTEINTNDAAGMQAAIGAASEMFLDQPLTAPLHGASFIVAFSQAALHNVTLTFSIGYGPIALPDRDGDDNGADNTKWYIIGGVLGGVALVLAGVCLFFNSRAKKHEETLAQIKKSQSPPISTIDYSTLSVTQVGYGDALDYHLESRQSLLGHAQGGAADIEVKHPVSDYSPPGTTRSSLEERKDGIV